MMPFSIFLRERECILSGYFLMHLGKMRGRAYL
jgi:hypothetical protein